MVPSPDLAPVLDLLERQRADGWHDGAQIYVSRHGETLLDTAIGESRPGRALEPDDVMLWYSSSKPSTAVAVLQLWEQGKLGLDDRIADYVDGWGAGKERCTIRHVLTHTGGFPMARQRLSGELFSLPYPEAVAFIAQHPAEFEPGTKACYHLTSGWKILGAVVEAVDGRVVKDYLEQEVFGRAGMAHCRLGVEPDEQRDLGDRLTPVYWKGHQMPSRRDGQTVIVDYNVEAEGHNDPWYRALVEPGGAGHGPARELARLYECLLGHGPELLEPRTVEVMAATHRSGMRDLLFAGMKIPWGLGVQVAGGITGGVSPRAFGHGGMASSRAIADPEVGLVVALVTNGLPQPLDNEQRLYEVTDAVYSAFGDDVAIARRPHRAPREAAAGLEQQVGYST
ncbi:MAG: beta-lactamase family protein [Actinobacteria bacterium]|nr:beta-lactamase family protein [Actinomycetota bacterium]